MRTAATLHIHCPFPPRVDSYSWNSFSCSFLLPLKPGAVGATNRRHSNVRSLAAVRRRRITGRKSNRVLRSLSSRRRLETFPVGNIPALERGGPNCVLGNLPVILG